MCYCKQISGRDKTKQYWLAKEFLKKNPTCKSQILSDKKIVLIYSIEQIQKIKSLIKPVSMTLNKQTNEKAKQKIC